MRFYQTASFALLLGGLGLSVLAGPALADARQDVLAATQRCGGIADDRTWLDCFYGSAQPMRAELGLPPAPAAQVRLVPPGMATTPAYLPPPAYVAPTYGAQVPAYGVPVNRAPAPPAYGVQTPPAYGVPLATPAQQAAAAAPPAPPPLKHNRNTGFLTSMFGGGKPIVANVRMSSYAKGKDGLFRVTLADGEIWRINDSGDYTEPKWKGPASRYVVNVYEGALGSYNFQVSDDPEIYKATRMN